MEKEAMFDNNSQNQISKEALEKIKQDLLARKEEIENDLGRVSKVDSHEADNRGAKFPEYGDKADENAQEISDFSTTVAAQKVLEKSLEDTEKALKRIEQGEYGVCKYCKKPIGEKRLIARPTAGACIACKSELQNNE